MRKRQHCTIDWSDLPQELLSEISNHFKSRYDRCKFRAVCKQWRSSTPFSGHLLDTQLPRQIATDPTIFKQSNSPIWLIRSALYLLQPLDQTSTMVNPAKPWLISVEELNPGKLRPRFPLTKTTFDHLPLNFPDTLNLLDFRVSVIGEGRKLCFGNGNEYVLNIDGFCSCAIKVVLLSDNNIDIVFALDKIGNLVSFELGSGRRRSINNGKAIIFDDIVNFKGRVCAIDRSGKAYLIDGCESSVITVISCPIPTGFYELSERRKLLVESFGELYLIHRPCGEFFEVYKLDFEQEVWDKVNSLRERILLVTFDDCFFVDAQRLPGFGGNCILFPKNRFPAYRSGWCYPDNILFEGANKYLEIAVIYLDEGISRGRLISSYHGLSDFFWPPPSWAKPGLLSYARILSGLYEQVKERAPCRLRDVSYLFA